MDLTLLVVIKEISVDKAECDWARLNKSIFNMEHGRIIKWILDVEKKLKRS